MALRRERSREQVRGGVLVDEPAVRPRPARGRLRRWWRRRRPLRSATVWTHRWAALVLGLLWSGTTAPSGRSRCTGPTG